MQTLRRSDLVRVSEGLWPSIFNSVQYVYRLFGTSVLEGMSATLWPLLQKWPNGSRRISLFLDAKFSARRIGRFRLFFKSGQTVADVYR